MFEQLVFSGGGARCFWFGGFLSVTADSLVRSPTQVTGVSGGALAAAAYVAGREAGLLERMGAAFERQSRNFALRRLAGGGDVMPHQRIYREVVAATLDEEALAAIADGPAFHVLVAHPPSARFPALSTLPLMLAYQIETMLRSNPHMLWPSLLGVRQSLIDGRQAARDRRLVDLICNAAALPPVFDVGRWDGDDVIDGGLASKAPMRAGTTGPVLVLLSRRYRNLPSSPDCRYVMPSRRPPVDRMDFTRRERIEQAWQLGEHDGRRFLASAAPAAAQAPSLDRASR